MVSNIWQPVVDALINRDRSMYYCGGTLFIDFEGGKGVGLNLNGKGFSFAKDSPHTKNTTLYIPDEVLEYVRIFYLEYKKNQEYYDKEVEGIECQHTD